MTMRKRGSGRIKGGGSFPRRVRGGIKARSEKGEFAKNWWARRWLKAMENLMDGVRLQRGQGYARTGQVLSIEERSGMVVARVQGSRSKPYKVNIGLTPFNLEQWGKVMDVLAGQAIFAAQLLAGEMPPNIEEAFSGVEINLFPARSIDLITSCSCPDKANPCKHVAAVHYILGNRFDEDPFLIFRLRGRTQEQIFEELRQHRVALAEVEDGEDEAAGGEEDSGDSNGINDEENDDYEPPSGLSKESLMHFWQMENPTHADPLNDFNVEIKAPEIPLPIFRRLGEPDITGPETLEGLLEDAYKSVSQAALLFAFHGGESNETVDEK